MVTFPIYLSSLGYRTSNLTVTSPLFLPLGHHVNIIQFDAAHCYAALNFTSKPQGNLKMWIKFYHMNTLGLGWFTLHYVSVNICVMGRQPDTLSLQKTMSVSSCSRAAFKSCLLPFLSTLSYLKCDGWPASSHHELYQPLRCSSH